MTDKLCGAFIFNRKWPLLIYCSLFAIDDKAPCPLNTSPCGCHCFFPPESSVEQSSCQSFFEQLGYCCGEESDPVLYFTESCTQIVQGSMCECAISHACSCLNRNTHSGVLEDLCFQICSNDTQLLESVCGKRSTCQEALGHVCRRNDSDMLLQCAQSCARDNFCVSTFTVCPNSVSWEKDCNLYNISIRMYYVFTLFPYRMPW